MIGSIDTKRHEYTCKYMDLISMCVGYENITLLHFYMHQIYTCICYYISKTGGH